VEYISALQLVLISPKHLLLMAKLQRDDVSKDLHVFSICSAHDQNVAQSSMMREYINGMMPDISAPGQGFADTLTMPPDTQPIPSCQF
jgi:hypothetical protein